MMAATSSMSVQSTWAHRRMQVRFTSLYVNNLPPFFRSLFKNFPYTTHIHLLLARRMWPAVVMRPLLFLRQASTCVGSA